MSDYLTMANQVARERVTNDRVRDMDRHEIIDEIHGLEDRAVRLESALQTIFDRAPANGEDASYLIAKSALEESA